MTLARSTRADVVLMETMTLVGAGLSNDANADRLHLSPLTVKTDVNRA